MIMLLMSSLVKSHNWSFLPRIEVRDKLRQESGKTKEKTGFPLIAPCDSPRRKNCGNDGNISKVLLLMFSLVILIPFFFLNGCATTGTTLKAAEETVLPVSDEVPKEVQVKEFILGPGDKIDIIVYRQDDLRRTVQIDTSGKITYPLLGDIQAAGLSIFQLRDKIRDGLSKYIINPQVSVGVTAVQSQKVIVLGEVKDPGVFSVETTMNALEAISRAGGFTKDAKQKSILLIRGGLEKPELITLNMDKFFNDNDMTQNIYLQNRDIIYVPATFIANASRFFEHLSNIITPFVQIEGGYFLGQQIEKGGQVVAVP